MSNKEVSEENILTPEGKKKLEAELNHLINVERPKNQDELALARSQGDLSENADYDAARNKQAEIEGRILEIKHQLDTYKVVTKEKGVSNVQIGSVVKLLRLDNKKELQYKVMGSAESDMTSRPIQIASNSPLARAIISHNVGETVPVEAPRPYQVTILEIK